MKKVCCWDLEGPISVLDFAAEIGAVLGEKSELGLQNYDMGEFFFMISKYDDYLIDTPGIREKLGIPEYQPGDTLRIMAPMYVACFTNEELKKKAKDNLGILPGIKELMALLEKDWEIFVISTSYSQFAYQVTEALNIPKDHVYCTDFPITRLKNETTNIREEVNTLVKSIFKKYLSNDKVLDTVLDDLNDFFWKSKESDYIKAMNNIKVRGGKRKERAVEDISQRTDTNISNMIAVGDSITDINMLKRVNNEGGLAISFNGNRFSLKYANIAVTTPNGLGILPVFDHHEKIFDYLNEWKTKYSLFQDNPKDIPEELVSNVCKNHFVYYDFVPEIDNLTTKTEEQMENIINKQERMREEVRGWAGKLG